MTTPQTAQALADEAKWLAETYGDTRIMASRGRATREEVIEAGAEFRSTIDNLLALATQADTERANWKRWCELAEAATQAEAPACPDPAGCLREGCNQNGDGSLCERYVEAEAPAAPAQADKQHANIADHLFIEQRGDGIWLVCVERVYQTDEEARQACRRWIASYRGTVPVRFEGVDPFDPARCAVHPMIPESWCFGFSAREDGSMGFGFRDAGPFVARAALAATPPQPVAQPLMESVEIRRDSTGALDEVVGHGAFHLEQMDGGHWWMSLGGVHVNLTARGRITATAEDQRDHGIGTQQQQESGK